MKESQKRLKLTMKRIESADEFDLASLRYRGHVDVYRSPKADRDFKAFLNIPISGDIQVLNGMVGYVQDFF